MNAEVQKYFSENKQWEKELEKLREIALDCKLFEDCKWGKPAYLYNGKIIVLLQSFKNNCCLLFNKGALIEDKNGLLSKSSFKVKDARRIEFISVDEITLNETIIKDYIMKGIELEK